MMRDNFIIQVKISFLEMFIWIFFHPSYKDFSFENLFRCVRGGFVWAKEKNFSQFILNIVQRDFCLYSV